MSKDIARSEILKRIEQEVDGIVSEHFVSRPFVSEPNLADFRTVMVKVRAILLPLTLRMPPEEAKRFFEELERREVLLLEKSGIRVNLGPVFSACA